MARSRFAARHDDVLRKWGDSVAQLSPGCAYLLGSEGHFIIVGTCTNSPITADTIPSERNCVYTSVDPVSSPKASPEGEEIGGDAGYRPRVQSAYYTAVYRHSLLPDTAYIVLRS